MIANPALFQTLWNDMMIGACLVDRDGLLVQMNLVGSRMLGWGASIPVMVSCHDLLDCVVSIQGKASTICPLSGQLQEQKMIWMPQTCLRCRNGSYCRVELKGLVVEDLHDPAYIFLFRDLSSELAMAEDLRRLASIPEESPFPIVEVDTLGHIRYANTPMVQLMEQAPIGQGGYSTALPKQFPQRVTEWFSQEHSEKIIEMQVGKKYFSWVFSPHPELGLLRGYAIDITEQKHAADKLRKFADTLERKNQELDQALGKAEASTRAKAAFLATMSHEIRTPLNGIMGMAELLAQSSLTNDQQECAETILTSGEGLVGIINDILDYSKNESGQLTIETIPFPPNEMMEDVLTLFSERAYRKGLDLAGCTEPNVPSQLWGDSHRVRQILCNFISNAIKFTDQGSIHVQILLVDSQISSACDLDQEAQTLPIPSGERVIRWVRLLVRDTGIGIAPNVQNHIFKMFTQADDSTSRRYGGTGLGLAICRQLAELMNGSVGVESRINGGSTFWCDLPFEADRELPTVPFHRMAQGAREILVLSALDASVDVLSELLRNVNVRITRIDSVDALRTFLEKSSESLSGILGIIVDHCHENELYELLQAIRISPTGSHVKVWYLGPFWVRKDHDEIGGATDGIITLPIQRDQLYQCVFNQSRQPNRHEGVGSEECFHQKSQTPNCAIDEPNGEGNSGKPVVLVVEDNPVNQKVAEGMLTQLGCEVAVVENGVRALEFLARQAVDLILMDGEMPEMDGLETTRAIRELENIGTNLCHRTLTASANSPVLDGHHHVPIISMTANVLPEHRQQCLKGGMDDYLTKPLHLQKLKQILQPWLNFPTPNVVPSSNVESRSNGSEEFAGVSRRDAANCEMQEKLSQIAPGLYYDLMGALESLEGDQALLSSLFQIFADTAPGRLRVMYEAIGNEDRGSLRRHIHQLKGSLGAVNALAASAMAEQLEAEADSASFQVMQARVGEMEEVVNKLLVLFQAYEMSGVSIEKLQWDR